MESNDLTVTQLARERYIRNKENREKGVLDYIPFYHSLPRLSKFIPGFIRGKYYHLTANSSVGKTQLAKFLTIILPYIFSKEVQELNYKIIYIALEESKDEFVDGLICALINTRYKINISSEVLNSYTEDSLNEDIIQKIDECSSIVEDIMNHVIFEDSISNPTGLYKLCRSISEQYGKHVYEERAFTKDGVTSIESVYKEYIPNDDTHFLVVCDHVGLLSPEKGAETTRDAMNRWSTDYAMKQIIKHWKWTVVDVIQQAAATEQEQYYKGQTIISKLKPSLSGYGDNKVIGRNAHVILSFFGPSRFEIEDYAGFNMKLLGDNFRVLEILKNRGGRVGLELCLLFEPHRQFISELPNPSTVGGTEKIQRIVNYLKQLRNG